MSDYKSCDSVFDFRSVCEVFFDHDVDLQYRYTTTSEGFGDEAEEVHTYLFEGAGEDGTEFYGEIAVPDYYVDDITFWSEMMGDMLYEGISRSIYSDYYGSICDAPDFDDIDDIIHGIRDDLDTLVERVAESRVRHLAA